MEFLENLSTLEIGYFRGAILNDYEVILLLYLSHGFLSAPDATSSMAQYNAERPFRHVS